MPQAEATEATLPPSLISRIFPALMLFCLLVGVWSYAIVQGLPWEKDAVWKPGMRLPVSCSAPAAQGATADAPPKHEVCVHEYAALADLVAKGEVASLLPPDDIGEIHDGSVWVRWQKVNGKAWQYEAAMSSWYFETAVRYALHDDALVAVEYRHYDAKVFLYAMIAALFTLLGIYLRRLRQLF